MSATNPLSFLGGMVLEIGAVIAVVAILFPQNSKSGLSREYQAPQPLPTIEFGFHPVEFQPQPAIPVQTTGFRDSRELQPTPLRDYPAVEQSRFPVTTQARAATRELTSDAGNLPPRIARDWRVPTYTETEWERSSSRTELLRPALDGRQYRPDMNHGRGHDYYDRY